MIDAIEIVWLHFTLKSHLVNKYTHKTSNIHYLAKFIPDFLIFILTAFDL